MDDIYDDEDEDLYDEESDQCPACGCPGYDGYCQSCGFPS